MDDWLRDGGCQGQAVLQWTAFARDPKPPEQLVSAFLDERVRGQLQATLVDDFNRLQVVFCTCLGKFAVAHS